MKRRNEKNNLRKNSLSKSSLILAMILCLSLLAGCGDGAGDDVIQFGSSSAASSSTASSAADKNATIEETLKGGVNKDSELVWAGTQFYDGEAIVLKRQLNGSEDMQKAQDVYLFDEKNNSKLLISGVPNTYTGNWFLTQEGYCLYTIGNMLSRIEPDGTETYNVVVESGVKNICQLNDGSIVLLMSNAEGIYTLAILNPETGEYKKVGGMDLGKDRRNYISASEEGLVLLKGDGFWDVNLETGELTQRMPISEYDYKVEYTLKAFQMVGGGCVEFLYQGSSGVLIPKDIEKYRTVITVLNRNADTWLQLQLDNFNKSNYEYYAIDVPFASETSTLQTEEQLFDLLESGEGADIITGYCIQNEAIAIERGYLEDLSPYMERTGVYVEDYFPTTFDAYKIGDSIYGANLSIDTTGLIIKEAILGSREIPDMETLVDAMLSYTEPGVFSGTSSSVLSYFLSASESLCGTVDWDEGTCNFQSDLFAKILEVAMIYGNDGSDTYPIVAKRISTGSFYNYLNEEQRQLAGDVYIGHLFDDGAYPGVKNTNVVHMNSNSKNKEGAWAVMSYLLSEENQKQDALMQEAKYVTLPYVFRRCPANIFVYDEVVMIEMEETALVRTKYDGGQRISYKAGQTEEDKKLSDEEYRSLYNLKEQDAEEILELMYKARNFPTKTLPIQGIIQEEAASYFAGERSLGDTCDAIQVRAQAYLDENK